MTARARLLLPAAGLAACLAAAPAHAVDGALYEFGHEANNNQGVASPTWSQARYGDEFTVSAPPGTATVGPKWWIGWNQCGRPGMVAHAIRWSARRTDDSESARLTFRWQRQDGVEWDTENLRDGLTTSNRMFDAPLSGVGCAATLKIQQIGGGTEPVRHYWIASPRIVMRDVESPSVAITGPVNLAWATAGQEAVGVSWSVADNMGSDGIGGQRILLDGGVRWSGAPGAGSHAVSISLTGVTDGAHALRVEVDGDGTAGAAHEVTLRVDRTPPLATQLAHGYPGAAAVATFTWVAGDPGGGFGLASTEVQVNAATDGSTSGTWVTAASRSGDGGGIAPDTSLAPLVADGVHAWRVVTRDVAGNVGVNMAPAPVVVDTTPPEVQLDPLPTSHVSMVRLGVVAGDNLQSALGIGAIEVEGNAAPDGTASGTWARLAGPVAGGPGRTHVDVPLGALQDGDHALRVHVRNGGPFGGALVGTRTAVVRVDGTSPVFAEPPRFSAPSATQVHAAWVATDALSGVARAEIEWRDGTSWRPLAAAAAANGAGALTGDTSRLPEGAAGFRLRVVDAAGNVVVATSSNGVDRTPPAVRGLLLSGPPWKLSWTQSDSGGFGRCPTVIRVSGPGTGYEWREIASRAMGDGSQSVVLPLGGLALGAYRAGVVACDAAGNTTAAETGRLVVSAADAAGPASATAAAAGAGSPSADVLASLRSARLTVRLAGARRTTRAGRLTLVRRVPYGGRVVVHGRLLSHAGAPLAGEEVELRDTRGRVLGRGRTSAAGRFEVRGRAGASGPLRVGVPTAEGLLPQRADVDLRVRVVPLVTLRASSLTATALGSPVVLSGRVLPAPRRLGATRKAVVLEWRDPIRRVWRPILDADAGPDGRFRFTWRFQIPGQRVPLRVRLAAERGWPLDPAVSPAVEIRVR
ncbi:MAG: hypothetical protein AB1416_03380 [Actinomycetota bacterium]